MCIKRGRSSLQVKGAGVDTVGISILSGYTLATPESLAVNGKDGHAAQ